MTPILLCFQVSDMAPSGVLFQIEKLILEVADSIVKVRRTIVDRWSNTSMH